MTNIIEPDASDAAELARSIPALFSSVDPSIIKTAIRTENLSLLSEISEDVRRRFENCPDAIGDLYWYAEIKETVDVQDYPCIHLAYVCSDAGRKIISRHVGIYAIRFDETGSEGITIGNCPWCGITLNVGL